MNRVGVAVGPDRRPVAVKRATSPSGAERLCHEAANLHVARHPQVVSVVAFEESDDGGHAALTTAWVPGGSLVAAAGRRRSARELVRILASAACVLSDLHDRGIVHGRISAEHVLVDQNGAAVLCGFAEAEQHADRPTTDDVAAMGRLIGTLAETMNRAGARGGLAGRLARLRSRGNADLAEQLAAIGRRAADPLATRRPSARALARQLGELAPEGKPAADPFAGVGERSPLVVVGAVVAVAVVAIAAVLGFMRWRDRAAGASKSAPPATTAAGTTAPPPDATAAVSPDTSTVDVTGVLVAPEPTPPSIADFPPLSDDAVPPDVVAPPVAEPPPLDPPADAPGPTAETTVDAAPACAPLPPSGAPAVDLDGDGCAEAITIGGDGTVTVGELAFGIGLDPGDQVLVGDWDCDGRPTLAVLRLPSGAVDVFSGWPAEGQPPVVATRITEVAGAQSAEVAPRAGSACADIAVASPDGTTVVTVG